MDAVDVRPTRLLAAIDEAERFVNQLPSGFDVGVVSFSTSAQVLTPPIGDRSTVRNALESMRAVGGTAMGDGIERALDFSRAPTPAAADAKAQTVHDRRIGPLPSGASRTQPGAAPSSPASGQASSGAGPASAGSPGATGTGPGV